MSLMENHLPNGQNATATKANFRVCLISLYSASCIGLRYLASVLRSAGFDVHMIFFKEKNIALDLMELPTEEEYERVTELLSELHPDLIGLSVRSSFLEIAREITRRARERVGTPIIWGGTHPTVAPDQSIEMADMICLGEGEHPLLELAQKISVNQDHTNIQNLWVRENGKIVKNSIGPLFQDVDALPFPDFVDENKYFVEKSTISHHDPGLEAFNLDIMTSRGCPYQCTYCSNSLFHTMYKGKGKIVRQRSVQNVLDELRKHKALFPKLKRVDFIDEVFSWDKEWVEKFVEGYTKDIGLPFHCMQHPNTTNKEVMKILKQAGLERVEIGIQTGSERVRKKVFERPVSDEKLVRTAQIMHDLNIVPFYDIIVDNPFETPEDKKEGLDLLLNMARPFYMHMFSLIYFPNTILTRKALEEKIITEDQVEGHVSKSFDQMYVSLKHPRPPLDRFWISLYSLTSKNFVPKSLIRFLSRVLFLQKHPGALVAFASFCNNVKLGSIAVKWLFEGKPVLASLGKRGKSKKQGSRIV
jgi:anaerobic magnesium-protoporphyrin IX monomethyl ester cyclase